MTDRRLALAAGLLAVAAWLTLTVVVVPGSHLPTGDGAHILAASWRIGASAAPLDDLLHRVTPHPPLAYAPTAALVPWLGVRTTLGVLALLSATMALVGLRWLRPRAHPASHPVALAVLLSSGVVFWSVDQHALDWPATAGVLLALGAVVRAAEAPSTERSAAPVAAACLLAAVFTKYTGLFALSGGILAALAMGAWKQRATWITAAIVAGACTLWGVWAMDDLLAYGATTMDQSGAGGPGGAINRDPEVSFAERVSPARLRLWLFALRDTLGWLPLGTVAALVVATRVKGLGARVALASAAVPVVVFPLLRIQPQPRYALLPAALLLAAALPEPGAKRARLGIGALAVLALVSLVYSTALYRGSPPQSRPGHRSAEPSPHFGDWPWPAKPTWPTRSPVEAWGTADALAAVDAQLAPADTAALIRFGHDPDRPSWAAIDLVARDQGIAREWVVADSPRGPLSIPPGMAEPEWAWVSWTDDSAAPALAWIQTHANIEGAITWWSESGTGGVVLPMGGHHHHH